MPGTEPGVPPELATSCQEFDGDDDGHRGMGHVQAAFVLTNCSLRVAAMQGDEEAETQRGGVNGYLTV